MKLLALLGDRIWNPWLLGLFLLTGLYYSVRTGFFQLLHWRLWLNATVGAILSPRKSREEGALTQFQVLATALASTIGTGSIAGVATAIFYGGPGTVFWMWVSALLSMMTGCAEKTLSVRYRRRNAQGRWEGGPMEYMSRGLGCRPMALLFCLCCCAAAIGGGSMVQANSIASSLGATFGWPALPVGAVTAGLAGIVILGGIGRIAKASEALVPAMAVLFLGGGLVVLICNASAVPGALATIVTEAFRPKAVLGGGVGYSISTAMRYGIARGVFTNEAGLGSSAIAHAASAVKEPAEQGMWGIFEVFVSTILVCTATALVILTTGVYQPEAALSAIEGGIVAPELLGAPLSAAAFETVLGPMGSVLLSVCLLLFAFSSILGWSYYGERSVVFLTGGENMTRWYRLACLGGVVAGSVSDVTAVWLVADICNGLMALPNLLALLLLSGEAVQLLKQWAGKRR